MTDTSDHQSPSRLRLPRIVAALASLAAFALAIPQASAQTPTTMSEGMPQATISISTHPRLALHDEMRRLWEDHITWTRLAIVTFAADTKGFPTTAGRLVENQDDIGDAIKPFYGDAAGNRLTALLHDHITIAVEVLQAAKTGNAGAFAEAKARWYANADDIADFLAAANPKSWPDSVMRADMKTHLDQTLAEAAHELSGDYAASVADYDAVHRHILEMADMLSSGIIAQFPSKVR
ncbi:hypothetical protein [Pedococcus sp. 5OH_020]|uniref:hypothetical protein n=1 Tax=Pedococcus sp. 5OH_020 TaxID=2989814 RepID=UPI0022E9C9FC|nr:hypothetical protein [Pedococcus sp. 5OH_020]